MKSSLREAALLWIGALSVVLLVGLIGLASAISLAQQPAMRWVTGGPIQATAGFRELLRFAL